MERAVYVLAWGAFALAALWWARRRHDPVALWAWRPSGALAAAVALVGPGAARQSGVRASDVGRLPIFNGLLLAYAVPAAMAGAGAALDRHRDASPAVGLLTEADGLDPGLRLCLVRGPAPVRSGLRAAGFSASGLELYAYSIVWLLFGVALLALGFLRGAAALRHAGMALVCLVVAKVFLIDMAGLQGLLRVFSFLGLGAALVGLGYAYRRFGFQGDHDGAAVSRDDTLGRRAARPPARATARRAAARLRQPGAVSREVRGGGGPSRRSRPARRPATLPVHREGRPARRLSVRHACDPARAAACASMPRVARPGGRRWSATRRATSTCGPS